MQDEIIGGSGEKKPINETMGMLDEETGLSIEALTKGDILKLESFGDTVYTFEMLNLRKHTIHVKSLHPNVPEFTAVLTGSSVTWGAAVKLAWICPAYRPILYVDGLGEIMLAPIKTVYLNGNRLLP